MFSSPSELAARLRLNPKEDPMQQSEETLRAELKDLLVTTLRLEQVKPESIGDDDPLFSPDNSFNLDSLSALELLSAIEYRYDVRFGSDGSAKEHFRSIAALATFVRSARR
jgi:acyl carrier protein